ncbi:MAG TPA: hypothetical protein VKU38_17695 [Ktedonobacteraceae bacterium]|nr:hypothetical protein [Ktedonobacteraceae bacterium]
MYGSTFSGNFNAPASPAAPVQGQISGNQITFSFNDPDGGRVIQATGAASASGQYTGTFNVSMSARQNIVASGVWSALPVANPGAVFAFALHSVITQGPDKGTAFSAAVVVDKKH